PSRNQCARTLRRFPTRGRSLAGVRPRRSHDFPPCSDNVQLRKIRSATLPKGFHKMLRNCPLRLLAALAAVVAAPLASAETRLLRFPDICNDRVVFTYGGDLWTVSAQGGTAIRLTAGPGLQQSAKFSPDCKQIAFTG